jgi:hypothetical protein
MSVANAGGIEQTSDPFERMGSHPQRTVSARYMFTTHKSGAGPSPKCSTGWMSALSRARSSAVRSVGAPCVGSTNSTGSSSNGSRLSEERDRHRERVKRQQARAVVNFGRVTWAAGGLLHVLRWAHFRRCDVLSGLGVGGGDADEYGGPGAKRSPVLSELG